MMLAMEENNNLAITPSRSNLENFSKIIGSMPYMGFRINVYKLKSHVPSSEDPPRYVYMPALLLDHCNPKSRRNQVSGRAELLFTVHMWDEELEAKVFEYVKEKDSKVQPHQIQVIPFESAIVTSIAPSMQSSGWMSYQGIQKKLKVAMICLSMENAHRLASEMKTDPSQFLPILKVKFSLETLKVLRKEICINIEHIRDGELFRQLLEHFPESETAMLSADGLKRLVSESLTKVVATSFDDSEVVTQDSVVYSKLRELIVDSQLTINEQSKGLWESVFWDKDNYRPDRAAKIITEAYNHSDDQSRSKLRDIFSSASNNELHDVATTEGSTSEANHESFYVAQQKEDLANVIKKSKNYVEWTGEKFQPKPMSLTRVHLAKFTNRQTFQDTRVMVSYSSATLMTDLHIYPDGNCCSAQIKQLDSINSTLRQQEAEILKNRESHAALLASLSQGETEFLWRIDNVAARMANAEDLESDEFSLRRYKLRAKVYFNDCGDDKGTHLSVFFKLVPGEYDGILEWPFPHPVTFTLYDQATDPDKASNVTKKAYPPLNSRHPTSATYRGYQKFISHELLEKSQFIKDDVILLKISVESTNQTQKDEINFIRTQMELKDRVFLTIKKQNDEFKDKLAKQTDMIDSMKLRMEKLIDELKDKFAKEVEQKECLIDTIKKEVEEFNGKVAKQSEQIDGLEKERQSQVKVLASLYQRTTGFLWRIDNVAARMAKSEILESDGFYTGQYGYKLKTAVYFNGDGKGDHLSVYFKLMPGEYDGLLKWPFPLPITFTLCDQATDPDEASNNTMEISVDQITRIPLEDRLPTSSNYRGIASFITHEMLKTRQYIRNDVMFLKIRCDPI